MNNQNLNINLLDTTHKDEYNPFEVFYYETHEEEILAETRRPIEFVQASGERLKKVRQALGLTQVDLCEKLDVKQNAYSAWENGKLLMDPFVASILSTKFGVTLDYIYNGVEKDLPEEIRKKI